MSQVIKLLVVEDSRMDQLLLKSALEEVDDVKFDYVITTSMAQTLEVIEKLGVEKFDTIILDLGLPDSVGKETFIDLYEKYNNVSYIVLTGLNDDDLAAELLELGAHDYLVKGEFQGKQLYKSIRYAMKRNAARQRIEARVNEMK